MVTTALRIITVGKDIQDDQVQPQPIPTTPNGPVPMQCSLLLMAIPTVRSSPVCQSQHTCWVPGALWDDTEVTPRAASSSVLPQCSSQAGRTLCIPTPVCSPQRVSLCWWRFGTCCTWCCSSLHFTKSSAGRADPRSPLCCSESPLSTSFS